MYYTTPYPHEKSEPSVRREERLGLVGCLGDGGNIVPIEHRTPSPHPAVTRLLPKKKTEPSPVEDWTTALLHLTADGSFTVHEARHLGTFLRSISLRMSRREAQLDYEDGMKNISAFWFWRDLDGTYRSARTCPIVTNKGLVAATSQPLGKRMGYPLVTLLDGKATRRPKRIIVSVSIEEHET